MGLTGLRLYGAIAGAVAVALLVAWVFRIDSLRARHLKDWQNSELKLTVSNTSLKECNGHIADNNKRIAAQADQFVKDKQQAAADLARANARWESTGRAVGALEASAKRTDLPACRVSEIALKSLEGL